jgi:hypothetical protein
MVTSYHAVYYGYSLIVTSNKPVHLIGNLPMGDNFMQLCLL